MPNYNDQKNSFHMSTHTRNFVLSPQKLFADLESIQSGNRSKTVFLKIKYKAEYHSTSSCYLNEAVSKFMG